MATEAGAVYPPLQDRPIKETICLFDVDGTLTPARRVCSSLRPTPLPWKYAAVCDIFTVIWVLIHGGLLVGCVP